MASLFAAVDRIAAATIDTVYGEAWTLVPMLGTADPNAGRTPDGARPVTPFRGVYVSHEGEMATPNAHDLRTQHRPGATVGHPAVDLDERATMLAVFAGDHVIRTGDSTRWRVFTILPDVDGRRRLVLNVVK